MVAHKKDKDTPAEQLLRMIEGPQPATSPAKVPTGSPFARLSDAFQSAAGRLWRGAMPVRRETDVMLWNLHMTQRILWVALAALAVYIAADLFLAAPKTTLPPMAAPGTGEAGSQPARPRDLLQPLSAYVAAIQQRNPFTGASDTSEEPGVKTAKARLEELAGTLVVVGIDRSEPPEAIIEDTSQHRTYFVKLGDQINGLTVREISQRGVVVTYEGEETLLQ